MFLPDLPDRNDLVPTSGHLADESVPATHSSPLSIARASKIDEGSRRYTTLHYGIIGCVNEVGTVPGRGREVVPALEADRLLSESAAKELHAPDRVVMSRGPTTCPACGAPNIMWGCDPDQTRGRDEIHPLVWHETEWMADTFICRDCNAGWIEPDDPEPITWVRLYCIEAI